jgi:hypothetical protein
MVKSMGKTNGYWTRHPTKDLQSLLILIHEQRWRILDPPTYYKAYCPCPDRHKTTVHLTPSGTKYRQNKLSWLKRQPCYDKYKKE